MATFLSIFPELREIIYVALLTSADPSPSPLESSLSREERIQFPQFPNHTVEDVETYEICNRYPSTPPTIASAALLRCNRQIHAELSTTIEHLKASNKLFYELDCVIVREQAIYPTWLLVPCKLSRIPCINVTVRSSGTCSGRSAWNHGCGAPGPMIWSLMALLNRFLKRGPGFLPPAPPSNPTIASTSNISLRGRLNRLFRKHAPEPSSPLPVISVSNHSRPRLEVGRLVLDVVTPILNAGEQFQQPETQNPWWSREEGLLVHPETIVHQLNYYLQFLFGGSSFTLDYGKFIAERVGSVHLRYDGEEKFSWDLAGMEHFRRL